MSLDLCLLATPSFNNSSEILGSLCGTRLLESSEVSNALTLTEAANRPRTRRARTPSLPEGTESCENLWWRSRRDSQTSVAGKVNAKVM